MRYSVLAAAIAVAAIAQAAVVEQELPEPWFKNGPAPTVAECEAGIDSSLKASGTPNMTLYCAEPVSGFVSLMQQFSAIDYRGTRIQYSATIKSEDVGGLGGLWMRVDSSSKTGAAFDNMQNRAITGTTDWTRYSVVLDVKEDAEVVSIGMLMSSGSGQLWVKDLDVSTVGPDVPVTDMTLEGSRDLPRQPRNLALTK